MRQVFVPGPSVGRARRDDARQEWRTARSANPGPRAVPARSTSELTLGCQRELCGQPRACGCCEPGSPHARRSERVGRSSAPTDGRMQLEAPHDVQVSESEPFSGKKRDPHPCNAGLHQTYMKTHKDETTPSHYLFNKNALLSVLHPHVQCNPLKIFNLQHEKMCLGHRRFAGNRP